MKRFLRKIYRCLILVPHMVYWAFASYSTSRKKDPWEAIRGMCYYIHLWAKDLLRCLGVSVTVHGQIRKGESALVVSNHLGYIDILVHASIFGLRFCPKAEIRSWPVLGHYVGMSHPIWIDRSSRLKSKQNLEEFKATLEHKVPLIVYPEGTSSDGNGILPFKTSPFELAVSGNFQIQPIVTLYRVPEGEPSPCWYSDLSFMAHLWQFLGIRKIQCDVIIPDPIRANGKDRKALAQETYEVISRIHKEYKQKLSAEKTGPENMEGTI